MRYNKDHLRKCYTDLASFSKNQTFSLKLTHLNLILLILEYVGPQGQHAYVPIRSAQSLDGMQRGVGARSPGKRYRNPDHSLHQSQKAEGENLNRSLV